MSKNNSNTTGSCKYIPNTPQTEKAIIGVQQAAEQHGQPLSRRKYRQWRQKQDSYYPTTNKIATELFESWKEVCYTADVTPRIGNEIYTKEFYFECIKKAAANQGEPLKSIEYKKWRRSKQQDIPNKCLYQNRSDIDATSWREVCRAAGITPYTDEWTITEMIASIRKAADDTDEPLTKTAYTEWRQSKNTNYPHVETIASSDIGPWRNACNQADVCAGQQHISNKRYHESYIKSCLRQAVADKEEPLTVEKYDKWRESQPNNVPCVTTITDITDKTWKQICISLDIQTGI